MVTTLTIPKFVNPEKGIDINISKHGTSKSSKTEPREIQKLRRTERKYRNLKQAVRKLMKENEDLDLSYSLSEFSEEISIKSN